MKLEKLRQIRLMVGGRVIFRGNPLDPQLKSKFQKACAKASWDEIDRTLKNSMGFEGTTLSVLVRTRYLDRIRHVERTCLTCGKTFFLSPSRLERGAGNYCSRGCVYKARRGKPK